MHNRFKDSQMMNKEVNSESSPLKKTKSRADSVLLGRLASKLKIMKYWQVTCAHRGLPLNIGRYEYSPYPRKHPTTQTHTGIIAPLSLHTCTIPSSDNSLIINLAKIPIFYLRSISSLLFCKTLSLRSSALH